MLELDTYTAFQKNWTGNYAPGQLVVDLASLNLETHHKCDSYYYLIGENDFIAPDTGQPIRPVIDTVTPIGKREGIVYDNLYSWAQSHEAGIAAWVSPPAEGHFPDTKIILHEITKRGRERVVLNRTVLANIDAGEAVDIANIISSVSINPAATYSDPETVRSQLFIIKEGQGAADLLSLFIDDPDLIEAVRTGRDLTGRGEVLQAAHKYAAQIQAGVSSAKVYKSMVEDGFIGEHNISCPPKSTFSELTADNSVILGEYKHVKNCGNCGASINKMISKGYRCPSCGGEYQGC